MRQTCLLAAASLLSLGACSKTDGDKQSDPTAGQETVVVQNETVPDAGDSPTGQADRFANWAGKWTGPEGMYVDIKSLGNGKFELEMQHDLGPRGNYEAQAVEHGIEFRRNGAMHTLTRTDGDGTGMKWLAGKKECLMVKEGEGYCRD